VIRGIIRERTYIGEAAARRTKVVRGYREDGTKQVLVANRPKSEWLWLPNADVEPLVSRELFEAANAALSGRINRPSDARARVREPLLRGRLYCGGCGRVMVGCFRQRPGYSPYYRCTSHDRTRGARRRPCEARNKHVPADRLERAVWQAILDHLFRPEWLDAELAKLGRPEANAAIERDLANWTGRREKAERKLQKLLTCDLDELESEVKDSVRSRIEAISDKIKAAKAQIASLQERVVPPSHWAEATREIKRRVARYQAMAQANELSDQQRRDVVVGLGTKVTLGPNQELYIDFNLDASPATVCAEATSTSPGRADLRSPPPPRPTPASGPWRRPAAASARSGNTPPTPRPREGPTRSRSAAPRP
jgi:hypothetical protein